jgi:hypothetical protein
LAQTEALLPPDFMPVPAFAVAALAADLLPLEMPEMDGCPGGVAPLRPSLWHRAQTAAFPAFEPEPFAGAETGFALVPAALAMDGWPGGVAPLRPSLWHFAQTEALFEPPDEEAPEDLALAPAEPLAAPVPLDDAAPPMDGWPGGVAPLLPSLWHFAQTEALLPPLPEPAAVPVAPMLRIP